MRKSLYRVCCFSVILVSAITSCNNSSSPTNSQSPTSGGTASAQLTKYTWQIQGVTETSILYYAPNGTGLQYIYTDATLKHIRAFQTFTWKVTNANLVAGVDTLLVNASQTIPILLSGNSLVEHSNGAVLSYIIRDSIIHQAISGIIFDSLGNVLANASVSDDNISTSTDAFGRFSFTQLANGGYAITPTLKGYHFAPQSTNASTSATLGAINVDFIAAFQDTTPKTGYATIQVTMPDSQSAIICYNAKYFNNRITSMPSVIAVEDDHSGAYSVDVQNLGAGQTATFKIPLPATDEFVNFSLALPDPNTGVLTRWMRPSQVYIKAGDFVQMTNWVCN